MENFEKPQGDPKNEDHKIDEETYREIKTAMFFNAAPLASITELQTRIQEQAAKRGISVATLEQAIMGDIHDEMANSVD